MPTELLQDLLAQEASTALEVINLETKRKRIIFTTEVQL